MLYKINNNLISVSKDDLIPSSSPRRPFNFFTPQSNKDSHLNSFFPSTIRLWNSIPDSIKAADSLSMFKSALNYSTVVTSY